MEWREGWCAIGLQVSMNQRVRGQHAYSVVECSPFGVYDHFAALGSDGGVVQLGDVLHLLDISAVRSRTEDASENTSTGLVSSG